MARGHRSSAAYVSEPRRNIKALGRTVIDCWNRTRRAGRVPDEATAEIFADAVYCFISAAAYWRLRRTKMSEAEAEEHADAIACAEAPPLLVDEAAFRAWVFAERGALPTTFLYRI